MIFLATCLFLRILSIARNFQISQTWRVFEFSNLFGVVHYNSVAPFQRRMVCLITLENGSGVVFVFRSGIFRGPRFRCLELPFDLTNDLPSRFFFFATTQTTGNGCCEMDPTGCYTAPAQVVGIHIISETEITVSAEGRFGLAGIQHSRSLHL